MTTEALIVVDVQNGFLTDKTSFVVPRILSLLESRRFRNTAFTQYYNSDSSPFERFLSWPKLKSEVEQKIAADLLPFAEHVFRKPIYSALTAELVAHLDALGADTVETRRPDHGVARRSR